MTPDTAKTMASGVGPIIAALIGAYQLWLKPAVDEPRSLPFDQDRLRAERHAIWRIRLRLGLFVIFVAIVALIPTIASVAELSRIDFKRSLSLEKVLVALVGAVALAHLVFLIGKLRFVNEQLKSATEKLDEVKRKEGNR